MLDFANAIDSLSFNNGFVSSPFVNCCIVFFGYLTLGISGFGSALIIVPLMAWQLPLTLVVPLVLIMDIPSSMIHVGLNYREINWRELPPLLPAVLVGAFAGGEITKVTSGHWLLMFLGLYVVWVGIRGFKNVKVTISSASWVQSNFFGFLMGLVEVMFGTAGPIVMLWLTRRIENLYALRATIPITLWALSSAALCSMALTESFNLFLITPWLYLLLPFALLGVLLGNSIAMRVNLQTLRPIIYGILSLSGTLLFIRAIVLSID